MSALHVEGVSRAELQRRIVAIPDVKGFADLLRELTSVRACV